MSIATLLPHTVTVQSQAATRDDGGGFTIEWSEVYASVACVVEDAGASEILRFGQIGMSVSHRVLTLQSGIEIGNRLVYGSKNLIVRGVENRRSRGSIPEFFVVFCEEILTQGP